MLIRTYKQEDEQQIIALWQQCNLTTAWNNPKRDIERKILDSPELFFVGEIDHKIVASCMAGYDGHRGWIYYLAVKPDHQKQGVASKIMSHAEDVLKDIGCPKIDLMVRKTNQSVIAFYHKIGYNDDPVVVLSKRLATDELYKMRCVKMDIEQAKEILGDKFSFSAVDTQKVVQKLNIPKDAKILDVGTGLGSMAIVLALHGYTITTGEPGDDESIYARQNWQENAEKVGVDGQISFEAFNANSLPFEDGSFDAIFSLGSFHHIEASDRIKVLKEFIRTTVPTGIICFFEPNHHTVERIKETDDNHPEPADPTAYISGLNLTSRQIGGSNFDAFIFQKTS